MILKFMSDISAAAAPALANHIWQSTFFACVMGLLTLAFHGNRARVRYGLWLAASLKFLIPFSLLVSIGSHLAPPRVAATPKPGLYLAMEQASAPFVQPMIARSAPLLAASAGPAHTLPIVLAAWLCGVLVVLLIWSARWRRVSALVREAVPLREGREVQSLRRLERGAGKVSKPLALLLSRASLEPGIFGIVRPVLLWPQGISERLADTHLDAVIAHELWHVRRRDNLAASLHMLVEAIFWFHPLVWWMGARLLDERERACDEEVLDFGSDRQVYAESILKICEFCVGSPLTCVSGVTGADLKKRIARIMSEQVARQLDLGRKFLLAVAVILAIAAPIVAGILRPTSSRATSEAHGTTSAPQAYATVSIVPTVSTVLRAPLFFSPDEFVSKNLPLQQVIRVVYGVQDDRIVGAPVWLNSEKYDFEAREDSSDAADPRKLSLDQRVSEQKLMLQAVLADRLKLSFHRETRDLAVYALVISKTGPKLQESKPGDTYPNGFKSADGVARPGGFRIDPDKVVGQGVPVTPLLWYISQQLDRTVIDETGLSATYDFAMPKLPGIPPSASPEPFERAISAILEAQIGLRLEPRTVPMEVLVIDHVERPVASQAQSPAADVPTFAVVSVKANKSATETLRTGQGIIRQRMLIEPGELTATGNSLRELIRFVYGVKTFQISGGPSWLDSELYDLAAKTDSSTLYALNSLSPGERDAVNQRMLQALLADQFHLALHRETKELPQYSLVVSDPGKLREVQGDCPPGPILLGPLEPGNPLPPTPCGRLRAGPAGFEGLKVPIPELVRTLSDSTQRIVQDRTGLTGKYDINVRWNSGPLPPRPANLPPLPPSNSALPPSALLALQQQLGLKVEPHTGPVELLIIDRAERPMEK